MEITSVNSNYVGTERSKKRRRSNFDNVGKIEEMNIHVVVRCRAKLEREEKIKSPVIIKTTYRDVQVRLKPEDPPCKCYTFDKVFGKETSQQKIFDSVVNPILNEVLDGFNCTLFAYGQTSTGKTYTMEGDLNIRDSVNGSDGNMIISPNAGVIPRSLCSLFQTLESESADYSVKVSYIELYNEKLKDLLSNNGQQNLKVVDDGNNKGVLYGHEEVPLKDAVEGINVLRQGSIKRQNASTNYNDKSSRSHSVFTITVHIKETMPDGEDLLKVGKFNFVDLAGSECIARTGAENKHAKEAGSKLTRLLQDSLGGKTKTCIIATISPVRSSLEETISTLDYATRAKNIRNKPVANQRVTKKALIQEYVYQIEQFLDKQKEDTNQIEELQRTNDELITKLDTIEKENAELSSKLDDQLKISNQCCQALQELRHKMVLVKSEFKYKLLQLFDDQLGTITDGFEDDNKENFNINFK
ncbi:7963_t:CDS:2 [Entrophospora sp. SA101]|nr:13586_t:CDS:2 [Entrophospora sp. SA101]CAJ0842647.1 12145_t:CDS:2 [Entrophospora sp. SA101]CAJ0857277.1 7963_t:CDS:2 [Entrophospora sp. SA101]CAJ0859523.1 11572_t:CDS:2 [Entrophospora sp. SA101]